MNDTKICILQYYEPEEYNATTGFMRGVQMCELRGLHFVVGGFTPA